jgi:hypothetical protein
VWAHKLISAAHADRRVEFSPGTNTHRRSLRSAVLSLRAHHKAANAQIGSSKAIGSPGLRQVADLGDWRWRPDDLQPCPALRPVFTSLSIKLTTVLGIRAHDHKTWEAVASVNFNFDNGTIMADHGAGIDFGEHEAKCKQDGEEGQICAATRMRFPRKGRHPTTPE